MATLDSDPFPSIAPPAYCDPTNQNMAASTSLEEEDPVLDAFSVFAAPPADPVLTQSQSEALNQSQSEALTHTESKALTTAAHGTAVAAAESADATAGQPVLINIIGASFDHSSEDEEQAPCDKPDAAPEKHQQDTNANGVCQEVPSDVQPPEASGVQPPEASDDFDELLNRPDAEIMENVVLSSVTTSTIWQEEASGDKEFRANFEAKPESTNGLLGSSSATTTSLTFSGAEDPFSVLVESAADMPQDVGTAMSSDVHFANTFSTTVEEDETDEAGLLVDIDGTEHTKNIVGNVKNKKDKKPEEDKQEKAKGGVEESAATKPADDKEGSASPSENIRKVSLMDVEVDMAKPMPMPDRLTSNKGRMAKKKKAEAPKPPPSSIQLISQSARKVLQTQTSPLPRPQAKKLPLDAAEAAANIESAGPKEVKNRKLLTQGQADTLTLSEQQGTVSLNFEITKNSKKLKKKVAATDVPLLPPPSLLLSPAKLKKEESSDSESDDGMAAKNVDGEGAVDGMKLTTSVTTDVPDDQGESIWKFEEPDLPPLEPYRKPFTGHGWNVLLRKPPKKSLTKKRFWEEVYLRLQPNAKGVPSLQFYRNEKDARKAGENEIPLQEILLNPCNQLSDVPVLQQYDHYGKCYCVKVYHTFYKERPGLRSDRVAEALPNFLRGYIKPKGKMVFEHAAQKTELCKLASVDAEVIGSLLAELQDSLMGLKDVRLNTNIMYHKDEIRADVWDEYEAFVDKLGHTMTHKCRIRLFINCFLSGMPMVEVGINEKRRRGKEVVGRKDIIPVKADSWITVENPEFHPLVKRDIFEETGILRFSPLDGSKFEIMRFRYRPKKNRELPLQLQAKMIIDEKKRVIEIRGDAMVPGYYSNSKRKGQVPCQDIQICFPIPEEWIYKFRVEKHFKYGSLHAAARRPGKIKGMERITTAMGKGMENYLPPSFIECSVGDAKYEHVFKSVVWRVDRLPQRNQGAYKTHYFALRLNLEPHDIIPKEFKPNVAVSFTMPHTTVSGTAIRSISLTNMATDEPPEKWVHHHARFDMEVELEFGQEVKEYLPPEHADSDDDGERPAKSGAGKKAAVETAAEDDFEDNSSGTASGDSEEDENAEDSDDSEEDGGNVDPGYSNLPPAEESGSAVDTLISIGDNDEEAPLMANVQETPSKKFKDIDGSDESDSGEDSRSESDGADQDATTNNGRAEVTKLLDI